MFSLLFYSIQLAVRMIGFSAYYAPPLFILSTLIVFFNLQFVPPWHVSLATIVGLMIFTAPYVSVSVKSMLHPYEAPPSFWRGVLLQPNHVDFMMFITGAFLLLGLVMAVMFDAALFFNDVVAALKEKQIAAQAASEYSFQSSSILVLLFGSQVAAGIATIIAVLLWFYFFRSLVRMPAHVDGYDISSEEAMDLTRHAKWKIFIASLVLNGSLIASGLWVLPWEGTSTWLRAIFTGSGVLLFLHFNISFSVILYQTITPGYTLRKRRGKGGRVVR